MDRVLWVSKAAARANAQSRHYRCTVVICEVGHNWSLLDYDVEVSDHVVALLCVIGLIAGNRITMQTCGSDAYSMIISIFGKEEGTTTTAISWHKSLAKLHVALLAVP